MTLRAALLLSAIVVAAMGASVHAETTGVWLGAKKIASHSARLQAGTAVGEAGPRFTKREGRRMVDYRVGEDGLRMSLGLRYGRKYRSADPNARATAIALGQGRNQGWANAPAMTLGYAATPTAATRFELDAGTLFEKAGRVRRYQILGGGDGSGASARFDPVVAATFKLAF